ncbi:bidirectional sugar transporter SWEET12-like [Rutidosis leptorrhynchoides]|uniref:bidirectional sugar transporter SWEET12-like n=1 Tax=Rutidosis leptorrhynchoides TaxID=125765 RepID=UPI003A98D5DE
MAIFSTDNTWVFVFGLLGNIVSFVVFLAPLPTFYRIVKKKSTEGFQSIPYVVALFSGTLWLYYASQKSDVFLLVTINSVGCFIETLYIAIYIAYATKQARMYTMRLVILLNFAGFCAILLVSHFFFTSGPSRVRVLGWVCVIFSVSVFVAPLSIMRLVIRTKSVEFMPFYLSLFLTLSAVMWLFYGIFLKDMYIALPNVLGVLFGVVQMILYLYYKNKSQVILKQDTKVSENQQTDTVKIDVVEIDMANVEAAEITSNQQPNNEEKSEDKKNKIGNHNPMTTCSVAHDKQVVGEPSMNGNLPQPILCEV